MPVPQHPYPEIALCRTTKKIRSAKSRAHSTRHNSRNLERDWYIAWNHTGCDLVASDLLYSLFNAPQWCLWVRSEDTPKKASRKRAAPKEDQDPTQGFKVYDIWQESYLHLDNQEVYSDSDDDGEQATIARDEIEQRSPNGSHDEESFVNVEEGKRAYNEYADDDDEDETEVAEREEDDEDEMEEAEHDEAEDEDNDEDDGGGGDGEEMEMDDHDHRRSEEDEEI